MDIAIFGGALGGTLLAYDLLQADRPITVYLFKRIISSCAGEFVPTFNSVFECTTEKKIGEQTFLLSKNVMDIKIA